MSTITPTTRDEEIERIEQSIFRSIVGRFATGVTVVTCEQDGKQVGSTASAFCSLSSEPPMVLVCLNRASRTCQQIEESRSLVINILDYEQLDLAKRFASSLENKFDGVPTHAGSRVGHPVLDSALAHLECKVVETAVGGTHTVFMAEVLHGEIGEGEPLAYFRGTFGRFVVNA